MTNELLAKYLAGQATPVERSRVEQWLAADPTRQALLEGLRDDLDRAAHAVQPSTPESEQTPARAAWQRLAKELAPRSAGSRAARTLKLSVGGGAPSRWPHLFAAAAAIVVAIVGTYAGTARVHSTHEYVAGRGQRLIVTLTDGSVVTLAPDTRLRLADDFGTARRDVALQGEAYFAVTHDPAKPFTVHSRGIVLQDVGTRFDVRAYADDETLRLVVTDGAVAVRSGLSDSALPPIVVTGGSRMDVDGHGATTLATGVGTDDYVAWVAGDLAFQHATVAQIARDLARRYDIEVRVSDPSVAAKRVTARFSGESLSEVLTLLGGAADVRVVREGSRVSITPSRR